MVYVLLFDSDPVGSVAQVLQLYSWLVVFFFFLPASNVL